MRQFLQSRGFQGVEDRAATVASPRKRDSLVDCAWASALVLLLRCGLAVLVVVSA